jgi:5-methylcytosine-specific restriction endonuclease McrA
VNYYQYINGPEWKARRARHLLTYKKRCQACHRTQDIQVHHRTYDRMGDELDTDLAVLCQRCHGLVHELHDTVAFSTLDWATNTVIRLGPQDNRQRKGRRRR